MSYWPGTNIRKSQGNAFTYWKTSGPSTTESKIVQIRRSGVIESKDQLKIKKIFTVFSKAKDERT